MKTLGKVSTVLARIIQIFLWIGAAGSLILWIMLLIDPQRLISVYPGDTLFPQSLNLIGFDVMVNSLSEGIQALRWMLPIFAVICSESAMIFRNLSLILAQLHTMEGEAFGQDNSPFTPDIIRMVREIGIFAISIPVIELVSSWILRLVLGTDVEISVSLTSVVFGLSVLYLSSIFSYGHTLQQETEDLV